MGCSDICNGTKYYDYLLSIPMNELQEELSIQNNILYELKSIVSTLTKQNINCSSEQMQLNTVIDRLEDIKNAISTRQGEYICI